MPLIFYDLVAKTGCSSPFFSPSTTRIRLALLLKGIAFETREVTLGDLREHWSGVDGPLGVEKATAPFAQREDGSYLMDGRKIIKWLDEAYPDRTCVLVPNLELPYDINSEAYRAAEAEFETFRKTIDLSPFFTLYAPLSVKTFSEKDAAYYTSDERLGAGVWAKVLSADHEETMTKARASVATLAAALGDQRFFGSELTPGWRDCGVYGVYRTLKATDRKLAEELFGGRMGRWVEGMNKYFREGLQDVWSRDPE